VTTQRRFAHAQQLPLVPKSWCGSPARADPRRRAAAYHRHEHRGVRTVKNPIYALAAVAAIVATPAAFASAADAPADTDAAATAAVSTTTPAATLATPGAHYTLVDAQGRVVGELVSESASRVRLRVIGIANSARVAAPAPDPRADRTFHPDYRNALTPGQMSAAWQAEIDRLFPQPVTGGG
jgi:hypothetical protein